MEWSHYFRPEAVAGVEALHASFVSHAYRPHSHPSWTIALMRRGAAQFTVDGMPHRASAGQLFVLEPETVHTGMPGVPGGWGYQVVYLAPGLIQEWSQSDRSAPLAADRVVFEDPALHLALGRLHRALGLGGGRLELDGHLVQAAATLRRHLRPGLAGGRDRPEHAAVRRAVAYLRERWNESVPLAELALAAGLSQFELVRCFSSQIGFPPHAFQIDLRIRRARALLRAQESPAAVAAACGFADQAHLTRTFKRHVGVTPGRYANAGG